MDELNCLACGFQSDDLPEGVAHLRGHEAEDEK